MEACEANTDMADTPTGQRAQCKLGYYEYSAVPENSTQCTQPWDDWFNTSEVCKKQVGFGQGDISSTQPSQYTYGVKTEYKQGEYGCMTTDKRFQCEMGYANGVKLDPWSTDCMLSTDNETDKCKATYGNDKFAWPSKSSRTSCPAAAKIDVADGFQKRAACISDEQVAIGTEFTNVSYEIAGQQCATISVINTDFACADPYGPNYIVSGYTQNLKVKNNTKADSDYQTFTVNDDTGIDDTKCTAGVYRSMCKKKRDIDDMKNGICLWTNKECGGKTCKQRCESAGDGWVAINPDKTCYSGNLEENECLCCTTGDTTQRYLNTGNAYFEAIKDTAGTIKGTTPYNLGGPRAKDLYLCKYAGYWDRRDFDGDCKNEITTDVRKLYEGGDNDSYIYMLLKVVTRIYYNHI